MAEADSRLEFEPQRQLLIAAIAIKMRIHECKEYFDRFKSRSKLATEEDIADADRNVADMAAGEVQCSTDARFPELYHQQPKMIPLILNQRWLW